MENPTFDELRANARALKRHLDEVTPFLSLPRFGQGFKKTLYHSYAAEFDEILVCAIKLAYQFGCDNFAAQKILEITPVQDLNTDTTKVHIPESGYRKKVSEPLGRYLDMLGLSTPEPPSQVR
ncbi:MAG: hypothetical protein K2H03_10065 [Muribaculaceae bacterium]|nr:hypothetical protein [Muribaculaceae bacterium]